MGKWGEKVDLLVTLSVLKSRLGDWRDGAVVSALPALQRSC